jgi:RNA polymerase sigma factor (TIGR02999 family)
VTELLQSWAEGDEAARDALVPLVYAQLRKIAQKRLRRESDGATIQATGLVHEAFLRLVDQTRVRWQNRAHFFAIAARVMRRILVEQYRARNAAKRGGPAVVRVAIEDVDVARAPESFDLDVLNRALDRLARQDELHARIVELRYFGGLTLEETAEAVGVSPATVKREWALARAWLKREMAA